MPAESAEERFIQGFSLKIEGSTEQNGSMIGFIGQELLQHDTKTGFVERDEGQDDTQIGFV